MSNQQHSEPYLMRNVLSYVRIFVRAVLPVPDIISRYKVRRTAAKLVKCDPWPGMNATGMDAAQLALLRLLVLQRETHRDVRHGQTEAATMLARAAIDTLITGLYCLHEPNAVAQLQGESLRQLPLMMEFLSDVDVIPAEVMRECIARLDSGHAAKGPTTEAMASRIDKAADVELRGPCRRGVPDAACPDGRQAEAPAGANVGPTITGTDR